MFKNRNIDDLILGYQEMNILVITSSYPRFKGDGTAPFVKSISENLVDLGHDVSVIAPYDCEVEEDNSNKAKVYRYKYVFPKRYHILGHAKSLESDVRLRLLTYFLIFPFILFSLFKSLSVSFIRKPDLIHVHWVLPNGLVAWILSKIIKVPYVVSIHGSDIYVSNKNFLFRRIASLVFDGASQITACSPELMRKANILGASEKVILLPWGADPKVFTPNLRIADYRNKMGYPQNTVIVVALGRMVYKKGFDLLVKIWPRIMAKYNNAHLIIGGDGPLKSHLEKIIQEEKIKGISLPGLVKWNEVASLFANSDIFVLPSIKDPYGNEDGLPTVLLEAMGSGLPVIASSIGGVPLVIDSYQNGILIKPGDTEELYNALQYLLNDKARRIEMGLNARRDIENKYNWKMVAMEFEQIFATSIEMSK